MDFARSQFARAMLAFFPGDRPGGTPKRKRQTRKHPQRTRLTRHLRWFVWLRTPEQIGFAYTHSSERRRCEAMGLKYPGHLERLLEQ